MKQLLTVGGMSAAEAQVGSSFYVACGRVDMVCNGRHISGHVIDERRSMLVVKMKTNKVVTVKHPVYRETVEDGSSRKRGGYIFEPTRKGKVAITGYSPVRMEVTTKGKFRFMFRRTVTTKDGKVLETIM